MKRFGGVILVAIALAGCTPGNKSSQAITRVRSLPGATMYKDGQGPAPVLLPDSTLTDTPVILPMVSPQVVVPQAAYAPVPEPVAPNRATPAPLAPIAIPNGQPAAAGWGQK